jgi:HSP20 family protein
MDFILTRPIAITHGIIAEITVPGTEIIPAQIPGKKRLQPIHPETILNLFINYKPFIMYGRCNPAGGAWEGGPAFRKFFEKFGPGAYGGYPRRPKYNVPINISDYETHYQVDVYAVGFAKENIKISVVDDVLYISGTRTIDADKEPHFSRQEYPIKTFERMVNLNGRVDTSGIKAKQEDSILTIILPKSPEAQQQAQDISVE